VNYVSPPIEQYLKFKNRCSLLYTCIQYKYIYAHREGGGERGRERRGDGQQGRIKSQSGIENTNMTEWTQQESQSINSNKHLPHSPFTGQFLYMTTFCIAFYESYLSTLPRLASILWHETCWGRTLAQWKTIGVILLSQEDIGLNPARSFSTGGHRFYSQRWTIMQLCFSASTSQLFFDENFALF